MKLKFSLFIFLLFITANAQEKQTPQTIDVKMAIYPGCEEYKGNQESLIKCFKENFTKDLFRYLDTESPYRMNSKDNKDIREPKDSLTAKLQLEVDKNGYITNITSAENNSDFKKRIEQALISVKENLIENRKMIEPAKLDNSSAKLKFNQTITLKNPNYDNEDWIYYFYKKGYSVDKVYSELKNKGFNFTKKEIETHKPLEEMAIYPGCEQHKGDKEKLIKCFGEKLGEDLLKHLNTKFPKTKEPKKYVSARLAFELTPDGDITNIKAIGDDAFEPQAIQALEKAAEYLKTEGNTIKPAKAEDGTNIFIGFTQDVKLKNPNYKDADWIPYYYEKGLSINEIYELLQLRGFNFSKEYIKLHQPAKQVPVFPGCEQYIGNNDSLNICFHKKLEGYSYKFFNNKFPKTKEPKKYVYIAAELEIAPNGDITNTTIKSADDVFKEEGTQALLSAINQLKTEGKTIIPAKAEDGSNIFYTKKQWVRKRNPYYKDEKWIYYFFKKGYSIDEVYTALKDKKIDFTKEYIKDHRLIAEDVIYPGCEQYKGDRNSLRKCFKESLENDLSKYTKIKFPETEKSKKTAKVIVDFRVNPKGQITNIEPKFGNKLFKSKAKQIFEKVVGELEKEGKVIIPAKTLDGSGVYKYFYQTITFENTDYKD